jgi:hypothetical protein
MVRTLLTNELLKGIVPIEQKFMQRNDLFALSFREGFIFGRVINRRICQWKPYPLIDASGAVVDIPAGSPQGELRFRDPRNPTNSILYLNTSTSVGWPWFFHGAFGVQPQYIQMYLRYPETQEIPGKFPNIDPTRPASGDQITPLTGLNSPYEQPTDFIEVLIQPKIEIGCEYYNQDSKRNHQPVLNILFCLYWVQLFNKATHPTLITDIALKRYRGEKAHFLTFGFGDHPHDLGTELQKDWKVEPLSLDEATALGGGR